MIEILGIKVNKINFSQAQKKLDTFLYSKKANFIITPNPEIVLESHRDEEYFYILNKADLSLADGIGLKFAAWLKKVNLPRVTGADFLPEVLKKSEQKKKKVLIVLRQDGLSSKEEVDEYVSKLYPELDYKIVEVKPQTCPKLKDVDYSPHVLISAVGFPYQEKLVFKNLKTFPELNVGISVGGAFDFLTRKTHRAPELLRLIGLEWLWRLCRQPRRYKRIFRAVVLFSYKVLINNLVLPFFYRRNVACWLYKEDDSGYKVLLVNRQDQKNHWQLPQGGTEGESLEKGGSREIKEELNIDRFTVEASYPNLFQYKFPKHNPKQRHQGYKGQRQGLVIAKFLGNNEDIKVNYWDHSSWKWVKLEEVLSSVHPIRKKATSIFLNRFKACKGL